MMDEQIMFILVVCHYSITIIIIIVTVIIKMWKP